MSHEETENFSLSFDVGTYDLPQEMLEKLSTFKEQEELFYSGKWESESPPHWIKTHPFMDEAGFASRLERGYQKIKERLQSSP